SSSRSRASASSAATSGANARSSRCSSTGVSTCCCSTISLVSVRAADERPQLTVQGRAQPALLARGGALCNGVIHHRREHFLCLTLLDQAALGHRPTQCLEQLRRERALHLRARVTQSRIRALRDVPCGNTLDHRTISSARNAPALTSPSKIAAMTGAVAPIACSEDATSCTVAPRGIRTSPALTASAGSPTASVIAPWLTTASP